MRAVTVKVAVPMTIGRVERERWYARGMCVRDERDGRGIYILWRRLVHRARRGRGRERLI